MRQQDDDWYDEDETEVLSKVPTRYTTLLKKRDSVEKIPQTDDFWGWS